MSSEVGARIATQTALCEKGRTPESSQQWECVIQRRIQDDDERERHQDEVNRGDRTCYAQWEDVGPLEVDDFAFVFGNAKLPRNTFDAKAGLDVSPAVWRYLGMDNNAETAWRFVDAEHVPRGSRFFDESSPRCRNGTLFA